MQREQSRDYFQDAFNINRNLILAFTALSSEELSNMSTELAVDYELFLSDYQGPFLCDGYVGLITMLQQVPDDWDDVKESSLQNLTLAQLLLVWAWYQNELARYFFAGQAKEHGWDEAEATTAGVVAAVSAAKSLTHASCLALGGPFGGNQTDT